MVQELTYGSTDAPVGFSSSENENNMKEVTQEKVTQMHVVVCKGMQKDVNSFSVGNI